ncbi:MAG: hypothetical protein KGS72_08320 [Cyanobacteria bacterium REEB67]|nr:hypothetical protein [Cyanobacteria bacterium REEB67]
MPELSISGDHSHARHHGRRHEAADRSERQPDAGIGSWGRGGSAQDSIAAAAHNSVGQQTYLPRRGSEYYGQHVPARLGCTSASTNMFFDGLKAAGKVSDRDYARIHAIGNDAAYANLQHLGVARPVSGHELKPGDWAYFKTPGHKHGHSGVVFEGNNGQLMLANNHGGRTIATPLSVMEQRYRTVRGLRAN